MRMIRRWMKTRKREIRWNLMELNQKRTRRRRTKNLPVSFICNISDAIVAPDSIELKKFGMYELFGVITHKGRSAEGGHYIGWVRESGDLWHKFDDDVVTEVKTDDIKKLSGGGDWHMAYICFYRATNWRQ